MGIVLAAITRGARVAFCARHTEDRNRFWKRPSVSLDPVVTDPLTKRESIGILSPSYQLGGVRSMDPRTVGCPDSAGPGKGQAGAVICAFTVCWLNRKTCPVLIPNWDCCLIVASPRPC